MHEASIALAIVDELCERVQRERIDRIARVHVRIGRMTSVIPDALLFAWESATDGTPAKGAQLAIEEVPVSIYCASCSATRTVEGMLPICPVCETTSTQVVSGRELLVTAMEVVHDAAAR